MFRLLVVLAPVVLVVGAGATDLYTWQVKCGLGDNKPPYGNDFHTRFGVDPEGTWNYWEEDRVHGPPGDPVHDLGFFYTGFYWSIYQDEVLHDAGHCHWDEPVGWPPPWKPWIKGYPEYPSPGLACDLREPILGICEPEIWLAILFAPNEGETFSFVWFMNHEEGFEVPDDIVIQIWANPDLEAVGIEGDLYLTEYGPCEHRIEGIPQWGLDEFGNPIPHDWVIQATRVPEPALAWLAGLAVSLAGLARLKRR